MARTSILIDQVQLAEASYARLLAPEMSEPDLIVALTGTTEGGQFSTVQANRLASRWSVTNAAIGDDPERGFAATIFQRTGSQGAFTLAIRGSDGFMDNASNFEIISYGAAFGQIVDLYNFWQRAITSTADGGDVTLYRIVDSTVSTATTFRSEIADGVRTYYNLEAYTEPGGALGTFAGVADPKVNVTGHSLGGHLATIFSWLFPESTNQVTVVNGAGVRLTPSVTAFLELLKGSPIDTSSANIVNLYGSAGPNGVAGEAIYVQYGTRIPLFTESAVPFQEVGSGHGIRQMSDAMAVYDLFVRLDPAYQDDAGLRRLPGLMPAMLAADRVAGGSFESMLDQLRQWILGASASPTTVGDRDSFYENYYNLIESSSFRNLEKKLAVLVGEEAIPDANAARSDFFSFVQLLLLSPIRLTPRAGAEGTLGLALYANFTDQAAAWFDDFALTDQERDQGMASFSASWLSDRALMAQKLLESSVADALILSYAGYPRQSFQDRETSTQVLLGGLPGIQRQHVVFGGDAHDEITGQGFGDRLYGGGGDDVLDGLGGNDLLEGNAGEDTLDGGDGVDFLYGGSGADILNGGAGSDMLYGGTGEDRYVFDGDFGRDTVVDASHDGQIWIDGARLTATERLSADTWRSADGTYRLTWRPEQGTTRGALLVTRAAGNAGDSIEIRDFTSGDFGIVLDTAFDALPATSGAYSGDADDNYVSPSSASEIVEGLAGSDAVHGGGGDDYVFADAAFDVQALMASPQGLFEWGGAQGTGAIGEWVAGGAGDDVVVGGNGNDVLTGAIGSDLMLGGAGDDNILSDRGWNLSSFSFDYKSPRWTVTPLNNVDGRWFTDFDDDDDDDVFEHPELAGDDIVYAGAGNDYASLLYGDDIAYGESGDDELTGGAGADYLDGGSGNDILNGDGLATGGNPALRLIDMSSNNADTIDGAEGNDRIFGEWGADNLFGGDGDDVILGDRLQWAGSYADYIPAYHGDDFVDAGAGDDVVQGDGGADTIFGGDGGDELRGDAPAAELDSSAHGQDFLSGGDGSDVLVGDGDADYLLGDGGNDFLYGDSQPGEARDVAYAGSDYLDGGAGDDLLAGGAGDDLLYGGDGNDTLMGDGFDNDESSTEFEITEDEGSGAGDGNDMLFGGAGSDFLFGGGGDDFLDGGVGDDTLIGGGGADVLYGQDGNDLLYGAAGDDYLDGGAGVNTLYGGAGNDTLVSTSGADLLAGGQGDDTYVLMVSQLDSSIDGQGVLDAGEIIDDEGVNRIVFLDVGAADDVGAQAMPGSTGGGSGADLIVGDFGDAPHLVVVSGALAGAVREIEFSDGSLMAASDWIGQTLSDQVELVADAPGKAAYGGSAVDLLSTVASGAELSGGRGDDQLAIGANSGITVRFRAGDGADSLRYDGSAERSDDNVLELGDGLAASDLRLIKTGAEHRQFEIAVGDGDDRIRIVNDEDRLNLSTGPFDSIRFADGGTASWADLLSNGVEVDGTGIGISVSGTEVDDRVEGDGYSRFILTGAGDDIIHSQGFDYLDGGEGDDRYVFHEPAPELLAIGRLGSIADAQGSNVVTLEQGIESIDDLDLVRVNGGAYTLVHLGRAVVGIADHAASSTLIELYDGTTLDFQTLLAAVGEDGLVRSAVLQADGSIRYTAGGEYDQRIVGGAAAELLEGGSADDYLYGLGDDDKLVGGTGDDYLEGGPGADILRGGAGDDYLAGGVATWSSTLPDELDGVDIYEFSAGDGHDVIDLWSENETRPQPPADIVRFDAGVDPATVRFRFEDGYDLIIDYGVDDSVTVLGGLYQPLAEVQFSGGSSFDWSQIMALAEMGWHGSPYDDYYDGTELDETLDGMAGNDSIYGWGGDDTLIGGAGGDLLVGGAGANRYVFSGDSGKDVIAMTDGESGAIVLPELLSGDLTALRNGADLVLDLGAGATVTIEGYFLASDASGWSVEFSTGATVETVSLASIAQSAQGLGSGSLAQRKLVFSQLQEHALVTVPALMVYDPNQGFVFEPAASVANESIALAADVPYEYGSFVSSSERSYTVTESHDHPIYETRTVTSPGFMIPAPMVDPGGMDLPDGMFIEVVDTGMPEIGEAGSSNETVQIRMIVSPGSVREERRIVGYEHVTDTYELWALENAAIVRHLAGSGGADQIVPAVLDTGGPWGGPIPALFRGTIESGDGNDSILLQSGHLGGMPASWGPQRDWFVSRIAGSTTSYYGSMDGNYDHGLGAWIDAGAGDDVVMGSDADDFIIGGAGSDELNGQAGADTYYISVSQAGVDTVTDLAAPPAYAYEDLSYLYGEVARENVDVVEFDVEFDDQRFDYDWRDVAADPENDVPALRMLDISYDDALLVSVAYLQDQPSSPYGPAGSFGDGSGGRAGVERFRFADAQELSLDELIGRLSGGVGEMTYGGVADTQQAIGVDKFLPGGTGSGYGYADAQALIDAMGSFAPTSMGKPEFMVPQQSVTAPTLAANWH